MGNALWILPEGDSSPNYAEAVAQVSAALPPDGVYDVEIVHDEWCALLTTGETCNCEAEVHPWRD